MLRLFSRQRRAPLRPPADAVAGAVGNVATLLGRPAVKLDTPEIQRFLAGKRILITGAGGSIGGEIARQAVRFCPARLVLLDRCEFGLFEIDRELRARWIGADIAPVIADVADEPRVRAVLEAERPQIVFHAAAHKHVPLMEQNPGEAIKNNVFGTAVLAAVSAEVGVSSFVLISTDKAVNPTSVMGATKRCAEMTVQGMNRALGDGSRELGVADSERRTPNFQLLSSNSSATAFSAVRFGNVLGSSGSVIPIFARQIADGGPVTVTHPEMRRFFMTIPEAAGLVMQAGAIGRGGEIFVLDMGAQVRILDLAEAMIRRAGLVPYDDVAIRFTGIRPGEKLEEELAGADEPTLPTSHGKIRVWQLPAVRPMQVESMLETLRTAADASPARAVAALQSVVSEFRPDAASAQPLRLAEAA